MAASIASYPQSARLGRMRLLIPALAAAAVLAALVLLAPAQAQAPARASAEASVASGDLGDVAGVTVRTDGRDGADGSASRAGMEINSGSTSARASRDGGHARAAARATATGVTLFGGLVSADRVTRTARAEAGLADYGGRVTGLVVNGDLHGDREGTATFRSGGATVTVNDAGAGLVRLTRAVAGFASGPRCRSPGGRRGEPGRRPRRPPQTEPTPGRPRRRTRSPRPRRRRRAAERAGEAADHARAAPARGRLRLPRLRRRQCADDFGGAAPDRPAPGQPLLRRRSAARARRRRRPAQPRRHAPDLRQPAVAQTDRGDCVLLRPPLRLLARAPSAAGG